MTNVCMIFKKRMIISKLLGGGAAVPPQPPRLLLPCIRMLCIVARLVTAHCELVEFLIKTYLLIFFVLLEELCLTKQHVQFPKNKYNQ